MRVCWHWRVDFFSKLFSPPAVPGTRKGLERFGGRVKTRTAGGLRGGGPSTLCTPLGGKKSGRREPAKVSRQAAPAPRSPAPYQGEPGCFGAGHHVPSPRDRRAKAEGAGCGLRRPLPPAPEPTLGPRGQASRGWASTRPRQEKGRSSAADGRAAHGGRRLPVSAPPGRTAHR